MKNTILLIQDNSCSLQLFKDENSNYTQLQPYTCTIITPYSTIDIKNTTTIYTSHKQPLDLNKLITIPYSIQQLSKIPFPILTSNEIQELSTFTLSDNQTSHSDPSILLHALSSFLNNDLLSAQYLLFSLLSSIQHRQSHTLSGYFPINLYPLSPIQATALYKFIQNIFPLTSYLPLSVNNLNTQHYIPEIDRGKPLDDVSPSSLDHGLLQLPNQTLVIVDETIMEPGVLLEPGVLNMVNLTKVMENASLPIILSQGSVMQLPVDLKFVVLSQGKTILPVQYYIPIINKPNSPEISPEISPEFSKEQIIQFRNYLAQASQTKYQLSEPMAKHITQEFITSRKQNPTIDPTAQQLMNTLEIARLYCKSLGKTDIDLESWALVSDFEKQRIERCALYHNIPSTENVLR